MSGTLAPYVLFEGIAGSGKSLQVGYAESYLADQGFVVTRVAEPGGTRLGEELKELLRSSEFSSMSARTEALLFSAARSDVLEQRVLPARRRGDIVLSDRGVFSTIAYQVAAGRAAYSLVDAIQEELFGSCPVTLVVLLDIPARIGLARRTGLAGDDIDPDRIQLKGLEFSESARQGFLSYARTHKDLFRVVSTRNGPETVRMEIEEILDEVVEAHAGALRRSA